MPWPKPITLSGNYCILEPLSQDHHDGLVEATKDGELWNLWYTLIPKPDEMQKEITRRLDQQAKGLMLPFTVIDSKTRKIVGMTTYCHPDEVNRRIEIGWTWYAKSQQRSALNTECKLMLLTHAFEILNCIAVSFRVHFLNQQSRIAVERLGAKLDGVLRNYSIMPDGHIRDICIYSIIPNEWPAVKANLNWHLHKPRHEV